MWLSNRFYQAAVREYVETPYAIIALLAEVGVPDAAGFDDGLPLPVRKMLSEEATPTSVTEKTQRTAVSRSHGLGDIPVVEMHRRPEQDQRVSAAARTAHGRRSC